jgi:hypothetical protein
VRYDHTISIDGVDEDQLDLWKAGWNGGATGFVTLWQRYGCGITFIDADAHQSVTIRLPVGLRMTSCQFLSRDVAIIRDSYGQSSLVFLLDGDGVRLQWDNPRELFSRGMSACVVPLTPASAELSSLHVHQSPSGDALPPVHLAADASARSGVTRLSHLVTAVGMPLNGNGSTSVEVFTSARNTTIPANDDVSFSASATTSGSLVGMKDFESPLVMFVWTRVYLGRGNH